MIETTLTPIQLLSAYRHVMALLFFTCFSGGVLATPTQTLSLFKTVTEMYEAGNYDEVIALLTDAVMTESENAAYHHLLAKSYGREAQRVNWIKAIEYARKTRTHLEIAVKLEANNLVYLDDLMDYYVEAPVFLGGNKRKAEEIAARIQQLKQLSQL